ncbi:hypothetical protein ACWGH3_29210 [Streptomyces sp. NPDC054884]|uniref:hypothetical protein n=1 Tax=Streptomyces sp. B21-105 TaxID=3039417 RepID=UPI002FF392EA
MAWDEWEQLKAVAAGRHSARMQLNHVLADQGGGGTSSAGAPSGKLRSDKAAWSKAGEGVGSLTKNINKALVELENGQKGLGKDSGCLTAVAQRDVYASWERYVKDVSGRCDALAGVFEKVGNDQVRTDEAIKAEIARLKVQYEDTPAVGGQAGGR